jgi:choline dehydrogenase
MKWTSRVQRGRRRGMLGGAKRAFNFLSAALHFLSATAMAVVDPARRVHGIAGLRVADAALMPTVVSGTTNAATIMTGERGADRVREPRRLAA